jgi:hypothetical protein
MYAQFFISRTCDRLMFCAFQLFVPSLGVFGISETVPFHLQLSGSTRCLRDLFATPPYSVQRKHGSVLRVSLVRQIAVDESHIGQKMNTILEECSLRPLPPGIFGLHSSTSDDVLNWEGEINLQDIDTPSFDIGTIKVMVGLDHPYFPLF